MMSVCVCVSHVCFFFCAFKTQKQTSYSDLSFWLICHDLDITKTQRCSKEREVRIIFNWKKTCSEQKHNGLLCQLFFWKTTTQCNCFKIGIYIKNLQIHKMTWHFVVFPELISKVIAHAQTTVISSCFLTSCAGKRGQNHSWIHVTSKGLPNVSMNC